MDWMDNYLNGMGEYKVTVSPADTHQWGVHKPSKLQLSMMQDSAAFDVQQMRLIQEARQALERHGASGDSDSQKSVLPAGYVTLAGLTWAPIVGVGTYAGSQAYCANFTGLGFPAGTWRAATAAELQSLSQVLPVATAQSVYGWVFTNNFNIWSSESGRIVNLNTGANNGTSNTNNFNILCCKTPA
jgi:hypothetical protein